MGSQLWGRPGQGGPEGWQAQEGVPVKGSWAETRNGLGVQDGEAKPGRQGNCSRDKLAPPPAWGATWSQGRFLYF